MLVRIHFLSVEPSMRGWIAAAANYSAPVPLGSVMRALCAGTVIESRAPGFSPGDPVPGWFGWPEYAVVAPSAVVRTSAEPELPSSTPPATLRTIGATAPPPTSVLGQRKQGATVVVPQERQNVVD